MAVTESSGNGYALYNGVKLPALPEWDRETYPYAAIAQNASNGTTKLYCCAEKITTGGIGGTGTFSVGSKLILYTVTDGSFVLTNPADGDLYTSVDGLVYMGLSYTVIWSNHDIRSYNWDGSLTVFFAASDPIPLDGMTVIEWDGDTEGLVSGDSELSYKVSDSLPTADSLANAVLVVGGKVGNASPEMVSQDGNLIDFCYGYCLVVSGAVDGFTENGTYFTRFADDDFISLLAYPTTSTEPDVPEKPTTAKLHLTSMLMGWLVGRAVASQRGKA